MRLFDQIYTDGFCRPFSLNFLAHQYLSFHCRPFMVGNFIADTLRGKSYLELDAAIVTGVLIHRAIDHYTDTHPVVAETRRLLYPHFGKYAAVVQDVYYDHFLALHWDTYNRVPLDVFVRDVYTTLDTYKAVFNERSQRAFYHMREHDWLGNYRYVQGIDRSLKGLARRASFPSNMERGLAPLTAHFAEMEGHFMQFFPALEAHVSEMFQNEIARCQKAQ